MGVERRTELEVRKELARIVGDLYPPGGEPANAFTEAVRASEAVTGERMRDILSRALQDSADLGVSVAVRKLEGVGYGFDYTLANESARNWALRYTDDVLAQLGTTTSRIVGQAVGRWVGNGEPLQSLVRDLQPAFGKQRARLIASTEVTRAYAEGSKEAFIESGVVTKLVWQASMDERVCIYCGSLHGKTVGIEESFDGKLPADLRAKVRPFAVPPAHPGCILPGNLISAPGGIDAMAKSFYVGECVEVRLSDGSKFTVTKNHPILTPGGWVAAQFLNEGMYVLSTISSNRIAAAIDPNNQDVPTAIEEVFDSFVKSSDVTSVSVPSAAEDLHGEGDCIKGNIDIVYANRLLLGNGVAQRSEIVGKNTFGENNAGLGHLLGLGVSGPLVSGHLATLGDSMGISKHRIPTSVVSPCPACSHSLRSTTRGDAGLDKSAPEHVAVDAHLSADGLFGLASEIAINVDVNVGNIFSSPNDVETSVPQSSAKDLDANACLVSEFKNRFASEIAPAKIVNIRYFGFSGHVYDLQSDMYELYICNGVIVKNCRCWLSPQVEEVAKPKPKPKPKPAAPPPVVTPRPVASPVVAPPPVVVNPVPQPVDTPSVAYQYLPSRKQLDQVESQVDRYVKKVALEQRITPAQVEAKAREAITKIATEHDMAIQFKSENMDRFLSDPRLKSQFETGRSGGALDHNLRADAEYAGLGAPLDLDPKRRPIYGYMNLGQSAEKRVSQYGDITFVLKDTVRERTTVTVGDSLYNMRTGYVAGTPVTQPEKASWDTRVDALYDYAKFGDTTTLLNRIGYAEIQIQNGVGIGDVRAVIDRTGALTQAHRQRLKDLGVEVWDK